jgi:hypothetical protein
MVEKNVQPDRDSKPGHSEYRSVALPTELTSRLLIFTLSSEQFLTVTFT